MSPDSGEFSIVQDLLGSPRRRGPPNMVPTTASCCARHCRRNGRKGRGRASTRSSNRSGPADHDRPVVRAPRLSPPGILCSGGPPVANVFPRTSALGESNDESQTGPLGQKLCCPVADMQQDLDIRLEGQLSIASGQPSPTQLNISRSRTASPHYRATRTTCAGARSGTPTEPAGTHTCRTASQRVAVRGKGRDPHRSGGFHVLRDKQEAERARIVRGRRQPQSVDYGHEYIAASTSSSTIPMPAMYWTFLSSLKPTLRRHLQHTTSRCAAAFWTRCPDTLSRAGTSPAAAGPGPDYGLHTLTGAWKVIRCASAQLRPSARRHLYRRSSRRREHPIRQDRSAATRCS